MVLKHDLYCLWVFQQQFFAQWQFIWFSINTIHVKYNFEFPRELSASIYFILWNNLIPHFDDIFDSREIALKSLIVISSLPLIKSLREKLNWAPLYLKTKSPFSPRDQVSINAVWFLCILPFIHGWTATLSQIAFMQIFCCMLVDPAVFGFFCMNSLPPLHWFTCFGWDDIHKYFDAFPAQNGTKLIFHWLQKLWLVHLRRASWKANFADKNPCKSLSIKSWQFS